MPAAITKKPLDTYEALALGRFDMKPFRDAADVGVHEVNFAVRVKGALTIAPDRERVYVPSTTDCYQLLLAALNRLKGMRITIEDLLTDVEGHPASDGELGDVEPLKAVISHALQEQHGPQPCKGAVQACLEFRRLAI